MKRDEIDELFDDETDEADDGDDLEEAMQVSLQTEVATQLAEHVIAAPEPTEDEWVVIHHNGISNLPMGTIVTGLIAALPRDHLDTLINARHIRWRSWYAGPITGVVHAYGQLPKCGPLRCCMPRLRADEKFDNGLAYRARCLADLREQEKKLLEEIDAASKRFDEVARINPRNWMSISEHAFAVFNLERELNGFDREDLGERNRFGEHYEGLREKIACQVKAASEVLYGCFDSIVADKLSVPIEQLGVERRPISCEHRDGKMVLALFNGESVEVPCA